MQTLAVDGRMGASGDMLLGALVAAGADPAVLAPVEQQLGVEYRFRSVDKAGIRATAVDVLLAEDTRTADAGHDHDHGHSPDHAHGGDRTHDHDSDAGQHPDHHDHETPSDVNGADHGHPTDHAHRIEGAGPARAYPEVVSIVESMSLPASATTGALAVFDRLGSAEAAVHGTDRADTSFHEVGADDAIADVVGVALLIDALEPDRIVTTPLATGGGEVEMAHGRYPVPTPAVVEIAEAADWTVRGGPVEAELLTPTGAAILAHYAHGVEALPPLRLEAHGYGAGDADFTEYPNVLRVLRGTATGGLRHEDITVLETNLDDVSPEVLGGLQASLGDVGALDVAVVPMTMKKARPGHLIKVIAAPEDADRVARRLAIETGTLGIRETGATHRWIADRRIVTTTLRIDDDRFEVPVKIATETDGEVYDVSAEFEDAAQVAHRTGVPVREIIRRAEAAARQGGALEPVLVHVVEADMWAGVDTDYRPSSLETDGFIRLSPPRQAPAVANTNHADADDPRLVLVDRAGIEADLKYEETATGAFPHLYGPLATDDVSDVIEFPRREGRFVLPSILRPDSSP